MSRTPVGSPGAARNQSSPPSVLTSTAYPSVARYTAVVTGLASNAATPVTAGGPASSPAGRSSSARPQPPVSARLHPVPSAATGTHHGSAVAAAPDPPPSSASPAAATAAATPRCTRSLPIEAGDDGDGDADLEGDVDRDRRPERAGPAGQGAEHQPEGDGDRHQ